MPKALKTKAQRIAQAQAFLNQTLVKTGYKKRKPQKKLLSLNLVDRGGVPCSDSIPGSAPKREVHTYSGERQLLGIATMHKSNMVPIFADRKEEAKQIAQMRRN